MKIVDRVSTRTADGSTNPCSGDLNIENVLCFGSAFEWGTVIDYLIMIVSFSICQILVLTFRMNK